LDGQNSRSLANALPFDSQTSHEDASFEQI
jgi:hypothetical protein